MKRMLPLLLALAVLAFVMPALAEGALTVTQENFYVLDTGAVYAYYFGRAENTGDAPVRLDTAQLDILDAGDGVLATSTYLTRTGDYLQPGQFTYLYTNQRIEGVGSVDEVAGYALTLNTSEDAGKQLLYLPTESVLEEDVTEGSFTHSYLTTTITNDTARTVFDLKIGRALLDASGNILYFDSDNMYNYKGVTPGSSIVLRCPLNSNFEKYYEENGLVPDRIDAVAFAAVDDPAAFMEPEPAAQETPADAEDASYATLQKGSKGEEVRALQQRLKDLGYLSGGVDGDFGNGTAGAVSAFQQKAGLSANGIADDATQKALFADGAPAA